MRAIHIIIDYLVTVILFLEFFISKSGLLLKVCLRGNLDQQELIRLIILDFVSRVVSKF